MLFLYAKKENAYVSKHNSNCKKQVILLMISNGEKCKATSKRREAKSEGWRIWHYLAIKKPSTFLRGITSKYYFDSYSPNCLHSFRTKNKLELHKKVWGN